jgi:putative ABC transport system ATP-binding protein
VQSGATGAAAPETIAPTRSLVELTDLRFAWTRGAPPLIAIDRLRIEAGERVLLRGASGSGKSTLLALIAGVAVPQAGRLRVLDTDLAALPPAARDRFRADHVGFVFQMFNLIPYLSVLANVLLPCGFSTRRRDRAIARGGDVDAEARRLLASLDMIDPQLLARPVARLSVGQQQRVAAARALMGAPELLIADEPTSALDTDRRDAYLDLLFRECERHGTTLLFVSHDASLAGRFDRCIEFEAINRGDASADTRSNHADVVRGEAAGRTAPDHRPT